MSKMIDKKILIIVVSAILSGVIGFLSPLAGVVTFFVIVALLIIQFIKDILDDVERDLKGRLGIHSVVSENLERRKLSKNGRLHISIKL